MVSLAGLFINNKAEFIGSMFGRNTQLQSRDFPAGAIRGRGRWCLFFFFLTSWSWQLTFNVIHHHESLGEALPQYSLAY